MKFVLKEVDNGYCRIYYQLDENKKMYCIQQDFENIYNPYICNNEWGEPEYKVNVPLELFEVPKGDSEIEKGVRNYLLKGGNK